MSQNRFGWFEDLKSLSNQSATEEGPFITGKAHARNLYVLAKLGQVHYGRCVAL